MDYNSNLIDLKPSLSLTGRKSVFKKKNLIYFVV